MKDKIIDFINDEDEWITSYINMHDEFSQYVVDMIFSERLYDIYNYIKYGSVSNNLFIKHPYFNKLIQIINDTKLFDKILYKDDK